MMYGLPNVGETNPYCLPGAANPTPTPAQPAAPPWPPHMRAPATAPTPTKKARRPEKKLPCPYLCTDATGALRLFSCDHNVQQHVREKHTDSRPYKCNICGDGCRGFNRPFCLYRHMRMIHKIEMGVGRGHVRGQRGGKEQNDDVLGGEDGFDFDDLDRVDGVGGTGAALATNNFAYTPAECYACRAGFNNREALLTHQHTTHGAPASPYCSCMACGAVFRGQDEGGRETKQRIRNGGFGLTAPTQRAMGPFDPSMAMPSDTGYGGLPTAMSREDEGSRGVTVDDLFAELPQRGQMPQQIDQDQSMLDPSLQTLDPDLGFQHDFNNMVGLNTHFDDLGTYPNNPNFDLNTHTGNKPPAANRSVGGHDSPVGMQDVDNVFMSNVFTSGVNDEQAPARRENPATAAADIYSSSQAV